MKKVKSFHWHITGGCQLEPGERQITESVYNAKIPKAGATVSGNQDITLQVSSFNM